MQHCGRTLAFGPVRPEDGRTVSEWGSRVRGRSRDRPLDGKTAIVRVTTIPEGTKMLAQHATPLGAAPDGALLLQGEGMLFDTLTDSLPGGWALHIQADVRMAWVAFVYRADTPQGRPLFTVCRWADCVGLFVQWEDGSVPSFATCTELRPILDMISRDIFTFAAGSLATVSMAGWADTLH